MCDCMGLPLEGPPAEALAQFVAAAKGVAARPALVAESPLAAAAALGALLTAAIVEHRKDLVRAQKAMLNKAIGKVTITMLERNLLRL